MMKTELLLLILFTAFSTGCLQGEKTPETQTEPRPVKEAAGIELASLDLGHVHVLATSPEGEVFLGLHEGVAVSYDEGKTWREIKIGEFEDFMAIAIDPGRPNLIYLGGHGHGVWKSKDYGKTWELLTQGLPSKPDIHALAADPSNPGVVYAVLSGDGIYKSTDEGATWTRVQTDLDTYAVTSLAVDRENPERLYAGGTGLGVQVSNDGGRTWKQAGLRDANIIALAVDNRGVLYAGAKDGVYRSEDKGESWVRVKELGIEAFSLNPANPAFMVAASKKGEIYISRDEGYQWTLVYKAEVEEPYGPAEEEELILISGPVKNYRPLAWEEKGLKHEGNVTNAPYAYDGAFDDLATYAMIRTQGCESNYAAVYEWRINESRAQPVLYYHWNFTHEVDRASIGAYNPWENTWEELHAIVKPAPMKKRSLRIPLEYLSAEGEVRLYFEVVTPCSVGVMQLYDVYLSVPE